MYQLSSIICVSLPRHPKEILSHVNHNGHLNLHSVHHISFLFGSYVDIIPLWTLTIRKYSKKVAIELVTI